MAAGGFWKPGTAAPGAEDREGGSDEVLVYNPHAWRSIQQQRQLLPIFRNRLHILYLLEHYPTVIIVGATGSGKTTQIPQYLMESGWAAQGRMIACTQPRRVAAISVASRVAQELDVELGTKVGYSIRFDEQWNQQLTKIKYCTDGMLLREIMSDPLLSRYSVVMVDEAHERSLPTDLLLGLLKKIQRRRKDLRLIISSATVDARQFQHFFSHTLSAPLTPGVIPTVVTTQNWIDPAMRECVAIMSVSGRQFPVEVFYTTKPVSNYIMSALEAILDIHSKEPDGDILVFLTGQEEVETLVELISEKVLEQKRTQRSSSPSVMMPLPLFSGLTTDQQMLVFRPTPERTRKIVVATNIAETSITIDGIVYVIDCGFVKIRTYNPDTGTEALVVVPTSQSSAQQRAGRAGRVRAGKCFRLYTEDAYGSLATTSPPELLRSNLTAPVLQLKAMGIDNLMQFDFMSPPPSANMVRALELLYALGALDDDAKLNQPMGSQLADFPVDPIMAKLLISGGQMGCSEEIVSIVAMVQVQSVFIVLRGGQAKADAARLKFAVYEGDHLTLLNVYNSFIKNKQDSKWCHERCINFKAMKRAHEIRQQLVKYMRKNGIRIVSGADTIASAMENGTGAPATTAANLIRKCLVAGYFSQAARRHADGTYRTVRGKHALEIHPGSVLFKYPPEWVIFHETVLTSKEYMREVTSIDASWLTEMAPHFYELKSIPKFPVATNNTGMPTAPAAGASAKQPIVL